jgi:hypothetical protein
VVPGRVGGGDDDKQRDHGEDGQGSETHGPFHEFEVLAAPVEVLEPEVAPASWTATAATPAM